MADNDSITCSESGDHPQPLTWPTPTAMSPLETLDGAVVKDAAETAFARRWGLSFRHCAG